MSDQVIQVCYKCRGGLAEGSYALPFGVVCRPCYEQQNPMDRKCWRPGCSHPWRCHTLGAGGDGCSLMTCTCPKFLVAPNQPLALPRETARVAPELPYELIGIYGSLGEDEQALLMMIGRRLARGRAEYGKLLLATDTRDLFHEASEELADAAAYLAMEALKRQRQRPKP